MKLEDLLIYFTVFQLSLALVVRQGACSPLTNDADEREASLRLRLYEPEVDGGEYNHVNDSQEDGKPNQKMPLWKDANQNELGQKVYNGVPIQNLSNKIVLSLTDLRRLGYDIKTNASITFLVDLPKKRRVKRNILRANKTDLQLSTEPLTCACAENEPGVGSMFRSLPIFIFPSTQRRTWRHPATSTFELDAHFVPLESCIIGWDNKTETEWDPDFVSEYIFIYEMWFEYVRIKSDALKRYIPIIKLKILAHEHVWDLLDLRFIYCIGGSYRFRYILDVKHFRKRNRYGDWVTFVINEEDRLTEYYLLPYSFDFKIAYPFFPKTTPTPRTVVHDVFDAALSYFNYLYTYLTDFSWAKCVVYVILSIFSVFGLYYVAVYKVFPFVPELRRYAKGRCADLFNDQEQEDIE